MAESFAVRWANKERDLGIEEIASEMVAYGGIFLPSSAAPCGSFEAAAKPAHIHDVFGNPADWTVSEQEYFTQFLVIGSDGAGNPFCVSTQSGIVYLFDHEDRFKTQQFVNSSVEQLAECLLEYQGEESSSSFKASVSRIDEEALSPGSFWDSEAMGLNSHVA